jgi:TPR repeat protein
MMFGLFGKNENNNPPNNISEAKRLIGKLGQAESSKIIRAGALSGNVFCQVFFSQLGLSIPMDKRTSEMQADLEKFTELAARSGDAGSQYNLAKLYMNKLDANAQYLDNTDIQNIKNAKFWHGEAAKQGLAEARVSLKNLEVFDF